MHKSRSVKTIATIHEDIEDRSLKSNQIAKTLRINGISGTSIWLAAYNNKKVLKTIYLVGGEMENKNETL